MDTISVFGMCERTKMPPRGGCMDRRSGKKKVEHTKHVMASLGTLFFKGIFIFSRKINLFSLGKIRLYMTDAP